MGLITDGYPALEVPHKWYDITNTVHLCTLNDLSGTPHVKVTKIGGLHSLPDADDNRQDHVGRRGQTTYPSYDRSRTITYEGVIRAKVLNDINFVRGVLRMAFRDRDHECYMHIGDEWIYRARVAGFESDDEQVTGLNHRWPYQRNFVLSLIQSDPRIYWNDFITVSGIDNMEEAFFTNPGSTDADPIITIHQPEDVVTIENFSVPGTTGGHAALRFEGLPDGDDLVIDFFHRRATLDGVNVSANIKPSTDWWDAGKVGCPPGGNTFKVTGCTTYDFGFFPAVA